MCICIYELFFGTFGYMETAKNRSNIKFDDETELFFIDYKVSHGVGKQAFVQMAVQEKILRVKADLKLLEDLKTKK